MIGRWTVRSLRDFDVSAVNRINVESTAQSIYIRTSKLPLSGRGEREGEREQGKERTTEALGKS